MATLKQALQAAKEGKLSPQDQKRLKEAILSGKMDAIAQREGLSQQVSQLKEKAGLTTVDAPEFIQKAAVKTLESDEATAATQEKAQIASGGTLTTPISELEGREAPTGTGIKGGVKESVQQVKDVGEGIKQFSEQASPLEEAAAGFTAAPKIALEGAKGLVQLVKGGLQSGLAAGQSGEAALEQSFDLVKSIIKGDVEAVDAQGNPVNVFQDPSKVRNITFPISDQTEKSTAESEERLYEAFQNIGQGTSVVTSFLPIPGAQFAGGVAGGVTEGIRERDVLKGTTEGVISGTGRAVITKFFNKLFDQTNNVDEVVSTVKQADDISTVKAKLAGMTDEEINSVKPVFDNKNLKEFFNEAVEQASKRSKGRVQGVKAGETGVVKSATDLVGDDFVKIKNNISATADDIGQQIDEAIRNLPDDVGLQLDDVKAQIAEDLDRLNVSVLDDGTLDFSSSDIKNLTSDQKLISDIWDVVGRDDPTISPRDAVAEYRSVGSRLYKGAKDVEFTRSTGVAERFRKAMSEKVAGLSDDLAELNTKYHDLSTINGQLDRNLSKEGLKASQFIKLGFGNSARKNLVDEIIRRVENIGIKHGILDPDDASLLSKYNLALTVDDAFNIKPSTGFVAGIEKGTQGFSLKNILFGVLDRIRDNKAEILKDLTRTEATKVERLLNNFEKVRPILQKNQGIGTTVNLDQLFQDQE